MNVAALLRRIARLEAKADDEWLIYTHEREEPDGSLTLLNDRTFDGEPIEVARIPANEVERHRRTVIRIERSHP
ncbi:hypothetical protein [Sulfuricystis thermophila]|uniref:hypothetical protein n=1 Tax=Sulfuricystis thermophila TaxID=2496847 RepID=UPI001035AB9B|nr:hypothetical protein [Sulfuricystis thermophila]